MLILWTLYHGISPPAKKLYLAISGTKFLILKNVFFSFLVITQCELLVFALLARIQFTAWMSK